MGDDRVRRVGLEPARDSEGGGDAERLLADMAQALGALALAPDPEAQAQAQAQAQATTTTTTTTPATAAEPLAPPPAGATASAGAGFAPLRPRSQGRGSRPRSRPQERLPAVQNVSAMASEHRSSSRKTLSRRKERRWANDRRAAAGPLPTSMEPAASMEPGSSVPHGNLSAYFPDLDEFDVAKASRLIFEQEYISVFEGFTDEMRKAFLNCEGGFVRGGAPAVATRKHAARLRPRNADDMFARVDKNLKMHLQTRATKPPFKAFVGALEDFLLEVIENPDDHDLEAQQRPPLRAALVRKVRVIEGQRPSDESAPAERAAVELVFKTGLHRLLTHGLCQFHGLQSKSVTEPGTELRALRVSPPRADSNVLGWSTVERAPNDDGGVEDLLFGEKVFRLDQYLGALAAGEQIAK